jgi:membrane protein
MSTTAAQGSAHAPGEQSKVSYFQILKETGADWVEDKAPKLAASLATYAMLSLAPLLVIITKIVGIRYRGESETKVSGMVQQMLPGIDTDTLTQMIKKAGEHGTGTIATTLSIIMAAYGATGVFAELQDSMNTIWEVKPKPLGIWGWIRTRFLSFATVLGIAFLLMVSTVGSAIITAAGGRFVENPVVAAIIAHALSLGVMTLLFAMIFRLLPDAKVEWRAVWLGAALTAVLFEVGKLALAFYIKGSATQVFGAAGSFAAILLWIYYSAQILFLGAEFTQVYARHQGRGIEPSEHAVKVTEDDRAQQGMASPERIEAKAQEQGKGGGSSAGQPAAPRPVANPPGRPFGPPLPVPVGYVREADVHARHQAKEYSFGAAGAAVGALAAGLATWYFATDKSRPTRKQAAAVNLQERLNAVEAKVGRVSRLKEYLEQMDVKERIDQVEHEVRRAGRHVRAKETGRPLWAVRLGDLIGGRWSNL